MAVANSVPFVCSGPDDLPAEGWDWVVETAARTKHTKANMLGALAVSVPAVHRSKGYARLIIRSLLNLAESKKLNGVVVPVRPTGKVRHPWVPIADYMTWKDDKGRPYDPWLRSHLASGGKIVGPCERSMTVHEPLGFWENWSQEALPGNRALRAQRRHRASRRSMSTGRRAPTKSPMSGSPIPDAVALRRGDPPKLPETFPFPHCAA